jgi:hypothetical protein
MLCSHFAYHRRSVRLGAIARRGPWTIRLHPCSRCGFASEVVWNVQFSSKVIGDLANLSVINTGSAIRSLGVIKATCRNLLTDW